MVVLRTFEHPSGEVNIFVNFNLSVYIYINALKKSNCPFSRHHDYDIYVYHGKPQKGIFLVAPATEALPPPTLELSGHNIFWIFFSRSSKNGIIS